LFTTDTICDLAVFQVLVTAPATSPEAQAVIDVIAAKHIALAADAIAFFFVFVDVYGNVTVENADAAAIAEDGTPIVIMVDEAKPSLPDTPHTVTTDNPHTGAGGY